MNTSPAGLALIEQSEGYREFPYQDGAGFWTVGIGHKILSGEDYSAGLTHDQAVALLQSDLAPVESALASLVPESCQQCQWDALADFAYNMGVGSLRTLLRHGWDQVTAELPRWAYAAGKVEMGLVNRRAAEIRMFTGDAPS